MKNLKNILKFTTDKIKSVIDKPDIPVGEAFAQMDADIAEAEKDFDDKFDETENTRISIEEFYLNILEFSSKPSAEELKIRFEELITKNNPQNFESDNDKFSAAKKIDMINKAYSYFINELDNN